MLLFFCDPSKTHYFVYPLRVQKHFNCQTEQSSLKPSNVMQREQLDVKIIAYTQIEQQPQLTTVVVILLKLIGFK